MTTPGQIDFTMHGKLVLRITEDGRLERGEGMSNDEFSRTLFDILAQGAPGYLSELHAQLVVERGKAETYYNGVVYWMQRAHEAEAELSKVKGRLN